MMIQSRKEAIAVINQLQDAKERHLVIRSDLGAYTIFDNGEIEKARLLDSIHATDDPEQLGQIIASGHNCNYYTVLPVNLPVRPDHASRQSDLLNVLHNATLNT